MFNGLGITVQRWRTANMSVFFAPSKSTSRQIFPLFWRSWRKKYTLSLCFLLWLPFLFVDMEHIGEVDWIISVQSTSPICSISSDSLQFQLHKPIYGSFNSYASKCINRHIVLPINYIPNCVHLNLRRYQRWSYSPVKLLNPAGVQSLFSSSAFCSFLIVVFVCFAGLGST